jgi:hypothetical protein
MLFKNPVRTSKRTPHFTITKINWLTLLLLHASHAALPTLNSSELPPVVDAAELFFKLSIKQSERQNSKFRCLSEATPYHHNVFTFTLFLPEGRAGVAWEHFNKMMLFLSLPPPPLGK